MVWPGSKTRKFRITSVWASVRNVAANSLALGVMTVEGSAWFVRNMLFSQEGYFSAPAGSPVAGLMAAMLERRLVVPGTRGMMVSAVLREPLRNVNAGNMGTLQAVLIRPRVATAFSLPTSAPIGSPAP